MTRVNVGIEPENLPDELLLAELREIKRLPYFKVHCKDPQVPEYFTLGKGHIKFFSHVLGIQGEVSKVKRGGWFKRIYSH